VPENKWLENPPPRQIESGFIWGSTPRPVIKQVARKSLLYSKLNPYLYRAPRQKVRWIGKIIYRESSILLDPEWVDRWKREKIGRRNQSQEHPSSM